jgi:hypothetical protein
MWDVESCEGHEPRAIAFERHESGILRDNSFDSIGEKMDAQPLGTKFFSGRLTSGATQIVNPATNVNGVVVRTAVFASPGYALLSTGAVKPASGDDSYSNPVILGATEGFSHLQYPVILPPGNGLWVTINNTSATVYVTYDVLS